MPLYEYLCRRCGRRHETARPMEKSGAPHRCPRCGKPAPRVPSLNVLETDTNNPLRGMSAVVGMPTETRDDVKAMRAAGIDMVTMRDRDLCDRRRGQKSRENLKEIADSFHRPIVVNT